MDRRNFIKGAAVTAMAASLPITLAVLQPEQSGKMLLTATEKWVPISAGDGAARYIPIW